MRQMRRTKNSSLWLPIFIMLFLCAEFSTQAQTPGLTYPVPLDEEHFPDVTFREEISRYDRNSDGSLSVEECGNVNKLNMRTSGLTSLEGVRYFYALTDLDCSDNQLTSLDLSGCTALTELSCGSNQLTSLDVNNCTFLAHLYCSINKLTSLNLSNCTVLTILSCGGNQLTSLDVSSCTELTTLSCPNNQLTSLDVSNCTELTTLECSNNQLTSLDVSSCTELTTLSCSNNQLTSLDVSNCTRLYRLSCYDNKLTSLNLSKNTALTDLLCNNNQLTSLDLSTIISLQELRTGGNYLDITLDDRNGFDLSALPGFDPAKASDWEGGNINGSILTFTRGIVSYRYETGYSGSTTLPEVRFMLVAEENLLPIDERHFPDPAFRDYLKNAKNADMDQDGMLSDTEIARVWGINCSDLGIRDLRGIGYFTALEFLQCYNNQLTSLDLSKNTALTYLKCDNNQLTSLDLSNCTFLNDLYCYNNKLTSLDLSNCTFLDDLYCHNNKLTSLDLSKNTALTYLQCDNNQLTSLDLSKNTALTYLQCDNNQLTSLDLNKNTDLFYLKCNNNQLACLDLSNKNKNYLLATISPQTITITAGNPPFFNLATFIRQRGGTITRVDYEGLAYTGFILLEDEITYSYNTGILDSSQDFSRLYITLKAADKYDNYVVADIDEEHFPDSNFRSFVANNLDFNHSGKIERVESLGYGRPNLPASPWLTLDISSMGIRDLTGIEYFPCMAILDCSGNQLAHLDLSKNTALESLTCDNNQLSSLDLSKNTALESLTCDNNQLSSLDLSGKINLRWLTCTNNLLDSLNVSGCRNLSFSISSLLGNSHLSHLNLSGTRLSSIDLSAFTQLSSLKMNQMDFLQFLSCPNLQLENLEIRDCHSLHTLDCSNNVLKRLDAVGCNALKIIDCSENQLDSLFMDDKKALENLDCAQNILTYLNVSGCNILTSLNCSNNKLKSIDISDCNLLEELYCQRNQISELDVNGFEFLEIVNCSQNRISELVVSGCNRLLALSCSGNWMKQLDIQRIPFLDKLDCAENHLTELDISQNKSLLVLRCQDNQIEQLDVSENMNLDTILCSNNRLSSIDLANNSALEFFVCDSNLLPVDVPKDMIFDMTNLPSIQLDKIKNVQGGVLTGNTLTFNEAIVSYDYETGYSGTASVHDIPLRVKFKLAIADSVESNGIPLVDSHFPDLQFRAYLQQFDADGNTRLSDKEIEYIHDINISGLGIRDLRGIKYFTELENLDCSNNELTSLDLSANTKLETLKVDSNRFLVSVDENQNFDLSSLPGFDPAKASDWIGGNINGNILTFTEEEVSYRYETGYQGSATLPEVRFALVAELPEENFLPIDEEHFPDPAFRDYLKLADMNQDGQLNEDEIAGVTGIDVSGLGIQDLRGIGYFTELESLDCSDNQLTSLDLSTNIKLETLKAEGNRLDITLDDRNGFDLSTLPGFDPAKASDWIGGNINGNILTFTEEEVSYRYETGYLGTATLPEVHFTLVAELPEENLLPIDEENFPDPAFREYIAKADTDEDGMLSEDEIIEVTSIHVSGLDIRDLRGIEYFTELESLDCSDNQLTSLDLSANTKLETLKAEGNRLDITLDDRNGFDLSTLPGFDPAKASDWIGGNINGNILTFTEEEVSYRYETGYQGSATLPEVRFALVAELPEENFLPIDEEHFPDPAFRDYLKLADMNQDGQLNEDEIAGVTGIDVSGLGIQDLRGIGYFTELESLDCSDNQLTSLDLSTNIKLETLKAEGNRLDITLDDRNGFDLSTLPGFDPAKASDWEGCTRIGNLLTFTQQEVTYAYATGYAGSLAGTGLESVSFHLLADRDPSTSNENGLPTQGRVYVQDRVIHTQGLHGEISIFTPAGTLLYRGTGNRIPVGHSGVHIVRNREQVWKVFVL